MNRNIDIETGAVSDTRLLRLGMGALASLALLAVLSGCHSWRDEQIGNRGLPLIARTENTRSDESTDVISPATWSRASGDTLAPSLDQLHRWAREQSPRIRAASAALAAAEARADYTGRWPDPEIDSRILGFDKDYSIEAALLFTLPLNRGPGAAGRAASFGLSLAQAELAAARFDAVRDVDLVLAGLFTARVRARTHEQLAERATAYAELARQRQSAGLTDPLDVSLVLADAAQDRRAAVRSRDELHALEGELSLLLGLAEPLSTERLSSGVDPVPIPSIEELLAQAGQTRPDWIRARLVYRQAEWQAIQAGRERMPNPSIGPAVTLDPDQTTWGVSVRLALPVFSNRGAAYREALACRDLAYEGLVAEGRHAVWKIERLHHHLRALDEQLAATGGVPIDAAEQALALAQKRYEAGRIDVLLLLAAHRAHADLQLELMELRLARRTARLDLERAVGRSWIPEAVTNE